MGSVYLAVSVPRNVSANTNSFHAKTNANTLVATSPGATRGSRIFQKAFIGPAPSIAAASSSSRGTAATKLRSIQIVTGSANAVYTRISPIRLSSRFSDRKSRNSAITSACCGSICTISSMIRYVVRNLNRNLASATAASSAINDDATTDTTVTNRLFFKKFQYGSPTTLPSITARKLPSVGCEGSGCGVSEYHSVAGLNAVDTIQKMGNSVISATSSPSRFSPARRARRVRNRRRRRTVEGETAEGEEDEDRVVIAAPPPGPRPARSRP